MRLRQRSPPRYRPPGGNGGATMAGGCEAWRRPPPRYRPRRQRGSHPRPAQHTHGGGGSRFVLRRATAARPRTDCDRRTAAPRVQSAGFVHSAEGGPGAPRFVTGPEIGPEISGSAIRAEGAPAMSGFVIRVEIGPEMEHGRPARRVRVRRPQRCVVWPSRGGPAPVCLAPLLPFPPLPLAARLGVRKVEWENGRLGEQGGGTHVR
eukprot:scaffold2987_cov105-Isochrysis_galbana.AAC.1